MRPLAVFALAIGCAWTGDARAQGSAETDRAALVAVYRANGGADWTNKANWLSGPIPAEFGNLTDLWVESTVGANFTSRSPR